MENQLPTPASQYGPVVTPLSLTERHLQQWSDLLDRLQNAQAPAEEVDLCQRQITYFRQSVEWLKNA